MEESSGLRISLLVMLSLRRTEFLVSEKRACITSVTATGLSRSWFAVPLYGVCCAGAPDMPMYLSFSSSRNMHLCPGADLALVVWSSGWLPCFASSLGGDVGKTRSWLNLDRTEDYCTTASDSELLYRLHMLPLLPWPSLCVA